MSTPRPAVCYIVSHYTSAGHTAHLPRFFQELSRYADVHVVLWSQDDVPDFPGAASVRVLDQEAPGRLHRMAKMVAIAWSLRRRGCRVFFIRIQYTVALVLSLVKRLLGIEVFLWHSGGHGVAVPPLGWMPRQVLRRLMWEVRENVVFRAATRVASRFVTGPSSMIDYYVREYSVPRSQFLLLDNDVDVAALEAHSNQRDRVTVRRALGLPEDGKILLYVGGVSPRKLGKGGDALYEVARSILGRYPEAHLVLVGPVRLPGLRRQLEGASWGPRVHFAGMVPFSQVIDYYLAADVCVFPVFEAGFPRVLLEAMALGVSFVSFDAGGIRDLAAPEQLPFVVSMGDTSCFVQQVERLLGDLPLRERLSQVGRERVKSFSTEVVAKDFFQKIVLPSYDERPA